MATRAGTYPRQKARERRRRFLHENGWRIAGMTSVPAVASAAIAWVWPEVTVPLWPLPLIVWAVMWGAASSKLDGTYGLEMGEDAEKWTSKELAKLTGTGARHFDHIFFDRFDVDHVLVSSSGVVVIETKYTDREVDLAGNSTRILLSEWRDIAGSRADKIRKFLISSHRFEVDISALVVVWGPRIEGRSKTLDGVVITRGRALVDVIKSLGSTPKLDKEEQAAIEQALESFIVKRDAYLSR